MNIVGGYIKIYATSQKFTKTQLISIGARAKGGGGEGGEIPHETLHYSGKQHLG